MNRAKTLLVLSVFMFLVLTVIYLGYRDYINNNNSDSTLSSIRSSDVNRDKLNILVNEVRAEKGLETLIQKIELTNSAKDKCRDMVNSNYWEHKTPDGQEPWVFIEKYLDRDNDKIGENLAYGFEDSKSVVDGWMDSPTHRDNILDKRFSYVGYGICSSSNYVGEGEQTIVVQHFASK